MSKRLRTQLHKQGINLFNLYEHFDILAAQFAELSHQNILEKRFYVGEPLQITLSITCAILDSMDKEYSEVLLKPEKLHWKDCMKVVRYITENTGKLPFLEAYSLAEQLLNRFIPHLKKLLKKQKKSTKKGITKE